MKTDRLGISKAQKFLVLKDHSNDGPQLLLHGFELSVASYDKSLQALNYNVTSHIIDYYTMS